MVKMQRLVVMILVAFLVSSFGLVDVHCEEEMKELHLPVADQKDGALTWNIDKWGHLSISGKGDYEKAGWLEYRSLIESAEVHVSDITSTKNMFYYLYDLVEVDVSDLDTSMVTDMSEMFGGCTSLQRLDLSKCSFASVTSDAGLNRMFRDCLSLMSVKFPQKKTAAIKNVSGMFYNCIVLEDIDLSAFSLDPNVDMTDMIRGAGVTHIVFPAAELDQPTMTDAFNPKFGEVEYDFGMLTIGENTVFPEVNQAVKIIWPANAKISIPLNGKWKDDAGNVVTATEINLSSPKVYTMFTTVTQESDEIIPASGKMGDIDWEINEDGMLTITGEGDFPKNEDGDIEFPWLDYAGSIRNADVNLSGITTLSGIFAECKNLSKIRFANSDLSNVKSCSGAFSGCESLLKIDWDNHIKKIPSLRFTFYQCKSLQEIDFSSFDLNEVTDIQYAFYGCESLTQLDISGMGSKGLYPDMGYAFANCKSLEQIDVSDFDT
ncbi:MAG: BspA family leucine-rich repeat surface protein, partial [Lachnospiraceae bacterium]|nr:BspA family leucine-rich repeat surface protein [Lachnospiraceae bacterium]